MQDVTARYRLVGVGPRTDCIHYVLNRGVPVVIGRDADCTIVVGNGGSTSDHEFLSRQHVVIEDVAGRGWCVHDNGSLNGTALYRRGRPPLVMLESGTDEPLQPGDVIELAGSGEWRLQFQRIPDGS